MKKLSLALLVTLCLFFPSAASSASQIQSSPIWNGKADTKWYRDSETEFTITTPEQLAGLAKLVNGGNDFNGKTVKLGANIMLNDTTDWQNWASKPPKNKWKPIGTIAWRNLPSFLHGHIMRGLIDIFVPESIQRALLEPTDLSF
ncbi:MAG: hypothetical protein LBH25_01270, partial [Fibromonadaceae bacterium]|nr:hypothetical protein [Fibromonadaceae bacterium]